MKTLYLVGGTGRFGQELAKGLVTALDEKVALVRSMNEKSKKLEELGWKVKQVDFTDTAGLIQEMPNAYAVVSAVSGPGLVDTEKRIIDAAKGAGASIYVPSQFGVDHRRWKPGFPFYEGKRAVLAYAEQVGLPTLSVYCGLFSDFIFNFLADPSTMTAILVNGGKAQYSFTKRSDIGFVLAKALADPDFANGGDLSIQGNTMSWREALAVVEEIKGQTFTFIEMTAEETLEKEQELLEKGDMFGAFRMHLLGEPARGSLGADTSSEAKSYGVELEPLKETLKAVLL